MSYQIAICDDHPYIHKQLVPLLQKIAGELGESFELLSFTSAEQLLFEFTKSIDILILDIQMGRMSGMDAAHQLRKNGHNVPIIFLTAMPEYALEGYDVHAYSFLVKPVEEEVLRKRIHELLCVLSQTRPVFIKLKNRDGVEIVNVDSIVYIESFSHNLVVHFQEHSITCSMRMSDLEQQLAERGFFRVHKSYLVNMNHILRFGDEHLTMRNAATVPISRTRRKDFLIRFTEFLP